MSKSNLITMFFLVSVVSIQTLWVSSLMDQRITLMNKVTSMQIKAARCETP